MVPPEVTVVIAEAMSRADHPFRRALTAAIEEVNVVAAMQKRLRWSENELIQTIVGDERPQQHVGVKLGTNNEHAPMMKAITAIAMKLALGATVFTWSQVMPPE